MLRWAAKKFFWSMVLSTGMMIVVTQTPLREKMNGQMVKQLMGLKQSAQATISAHAPDSVKDLLPEPEARSGIYTTAELENTVAEKRSVSSSSNEYVINDQQYVYIRGKYYKARADNTYVVDGERVFHVSNRSARGKSQDSRGPSASDKGGMPDVGDMKIPTSPSEMMEVMKKAQENMKKRNQMLEELEGM